MTADKLTIQVVALIAIAVLTASPAFGQEWTPDKSQQVEQPKPYSPYVDQHFPQRVYFGDTHHHSALSADAGLVNNRLGPDVSFRFARGEEIVTSTGLRAKLNRPLDFLVVADHAEYLGIADLLATANPTLLATEVGQGWYEAMQQGGEAGWDAVIVIANDIATGKPRFRDPKIERTVWDRVVDIASQYNQPGTFTAFNGYEYTPAPDGNNLHRVVIFRGRARSGETGHPFQWFRQS